jgi:hypothetical protein
VNKKHEDSLSFDYGVGGLRKETDWVGAFVIGLAGTILVTGIAPVMVTTLGAACIPITFVVTLTGWLLCLFPAELAAMMPNRVGGSRRSQQHQRVSLSLPRPKLVRMRRSGAVCAISPRIRRLIAIDRAHALEIFAVHFAAPMCARQRQRDARRSAANVPGRLLGETPFAPHSGWACDRRLRRFATSP